MIVCKSCAWTGCNPVQDSWLEKCIRQIIVNLLKTNCYLELPLYVCLTIVCICDDCMYANVLDVCMYAE